MTQMKTIDRSKEKLQQEMASHVPAQPWLKEVDDDTLERWAAFMKTDLYEKLLAVTQERRMRIASILINPAPLKKNCEDLGVGIEYFQGIIKESTEIEEFFRIITVERNRRIERQRQLQPS